MKRAIVLLLFLVSHVCYGQYNPAADANCQGWWEFEDGALAVDSSVNNLIGTVISGNTSANTSIFWQGAASAYNGSSTWSSLIVLDTNLNSDFPLKSGTSNKVFTWCIAVRTTFLGRRAFMGKYNYTGKQSFLLLDETGVPTLWTGYNSGANTEVTSYTGGTMSANQWYHIAVTYDDSTKAYRIRVWDDSAGALLGADETGTLTNNISLSDAPFNVGNIDPTFSGHVGYLDDVVVFNRVLTVDEIDAIRNQTFGAAAAGSYLIGYYEP